jgi:hypothetical protein
VIGAAGQAVPGPRGITDGKTDRTGKTAFSQVLSGFGIGQAWLFDPGLCGPAWNVFGKM